MENLKEKINETCEAYLEYAKEQINKAKNDINDGKAISSEDANNISDCIRTIHHIVSIMGKLKTPIE